LAAIVLAVLPVAVGAAIATGNWLRQQHAAKVHRQEQARHAIATALTLADELRRKESWSEGLRLLTETSTHLAEADSPQLESQLAQARSDFRVAADLEGVMGGSAVGSNDLYNYKDRDAEFRKAFQRAGLEIGDVAEPAAEYIRASAIREQLVAAVDDWALDAFLLNDGPLVKRLLRIAKLADPEPRWRDRFRNPSSWSSEQQLLRLAAEAFKTSPSPSAHQLTLLARLLRQKGDWNQSARLLTEACRRQPDNFWLNRDTGCAVAAENFAGSVSYFRAAIALRPDNEQVHTGLALSLFSIGQTEEAITEYHRVIELNPLDSTARLNLVGALADTGRWAEASDECQRAIANDPADSRAPVRLAVVLLEQQRDEEAISLYHKAFVAMTKDVKSQYYNKKDPSAYHSLASACVRTRRHDEAISALSKVTELNPKDAASRHMLANELVVVGRPNEAVTELRAAIELVPRAAAYINDLGMLLRAQGRSEEALSTFQKAAKADPRSIVAWDGLALSLLDIDRFTEARAAEERLLELSKTEAERRMRRQRLTHCDELLSVQADIPAMLTGKQQPEKVSVQLALAEWCLKNKRLSATAEGYYETALSAQPARADDLDVGNRFDAACAAALAGCGVGADAAKLDDRRRAVLRRQALDWLTAEYNAWAARHRGAKPGDLAVVTTAVRSWLTNQDLAEVRDEQALANFPVQERQDWQRLWSNVAALAERDPITLLDRARMHIRFCKWGEAAACYADRFDLEPSDDAEVWFEYAAAQLLAGDRTGYRRTCGQMLVRCQSSQCAPCLVARTCTLASDSHADAEKASRLASNELRLNSAAYWSLTEQGALDVRTGRFRMSIEPLGRSLAADNRPGRAVVNWLWLAIACWKLGQADEARQWLAKADRWLDQQVGRMPCATPTLQLHLNDWLEAHVLRREAEALIRQPENHYER
jgi:tetratricopeptide (TPR) repeat protein